jgi:autophagy-related protein 2
MLRVEVRTESPSGLPQRSGAILLDLHDIEVEIREAPPNTTPPKKARFSRSSGKTLKEVAAMSWRLGLVAHTGPMGKRPNLFSWYVTHLDAESKARGILSIGALHHEADERLSPLIPRLYLRSSESTTSEQKTTTVEALIPFIGVDIGKPGLDSLQLWADDVTQWMERALGDDRTLADSRGTSIIGSRYFEQRTASVVESEASGRLEQRSEFAIKLVVSEGVDTST